MPEQGRHEVRAFVALLAITAAWGSTFFMIKDIVTRVPVPDLLAVRFAIATLAMLIFTGRRLRLTRANLRRGVFLGLLYGAAQLLQTYGLAYTSASVSGFITGLYVVLTPLIAALILKVKVPTLTWLAAGLAMAGLSVLSLQGFAIGFGELLTFASAVVYATHIVALSKLTDAANAESLTVIQLAVIALMSTAAALPGGITLPSTGLDWTILIYLALVAGALTMLLQTWAQAHLDASRAAVIMAMEPVWAAFFAVTLGGENLTVRVVVGGLSILTAMYLVEGVPAMRRRRLARRPDPEETYR